MPVGYQSAGVDFDSIFDPYVSGTKSALSGLEDGGVDLRERYAPRALGLKADDVGYLSGGQDVSNLWAAIGTASYISDLLSSDISGVGAATSATIQVKVNTNGEIQITAETGGGNIRYHNPIGAGVGSLYQARITGTVNGLRNAGGASASLTGKGGVSFTAAPLPGNTAPFDTGWQNPDAAANFLTMQANSSGNSGLGSVDGTMLIEVRRISDSVVIKSQSIGFRCEADSQL